MNSKRSYLDSLNDGRARRSQTSLDELDRTLAALEGRLGAGREGMQRDGADDIARRMQHLAGRAARQSAPREERYGGSASTGRSLDALARDIEQARIQEEGMAAVGRIAGELKELREELRHQMTAGLRAEFEVLRKDIERAWQAAATGAHGAELGIELERLSGAIRSLAGRGDDGGVNMLRLEVEQVRNALDSLAREETVRSVGRRWDEFDRRWSDAEKRREMPDPAFDLLNARLEQINDAVNGLPESLPLRSLEDKVRTLAGVIDQFSRQQERGSPQAFELIGERLDEISRAIVASSLAAPVASFDPQPFERIEARITSLARQIEELAEDRPVREVADGLARLSERVDEIARRTDLPEATVRKLAQQIAAVAEKFETGHGAEADRMFRGFEERFAGLSAMLERRQNDASEQGQTLFRDLERRLGDLAERLDRRAEIPAAADAALMDAIDARFETLSHRLEASADSPAMRNLEARLEDISSRLDQSALRASGIDPDLIRNLESQVAGLSEHLSRPGRPLPEFEDIAPRLDQIEQSIIESRESLLSAARQAAEDAIRSFAGSAPDETAAAALAGDLKSLEALARKSDERNARTFEAIHDTLLKIVDRLSALEGSEHAGLPSDHTRLSDIEAAKLALGEVPPMEPDEYGPSLDDDDSSSAQSPSEAAAAAALAALHEEMAGETKGRSRKRSMLSGLTRALSGRKEASQPVALAGSEPVEGNLALAPEIDLDEPLDPKIANRPLEPGSGAPDLSAIMKRVRDDRRQSSEPGSSEAAKSDFIAAARRAAQAAAAEAEVLKRQAERKNAGSGKFGLAEVFRSRRKPLLMAAGAVLIALAGLQLGKAFLADPQTVAADDGQAAKGSPVEDAALETDRAAEAETAALPEEPQPEAGVPAAQPVARNVELSPAAEATSSGARPSSEAETTSTDAAEAAARQAADPRPVAAAPVEPEKAAPAAPTVIEVPEEAGPVALRQAAANGEAKALFEIGARYAEGRGPAENLAEAAKWYQRSADLGFAPAQYRIGNMYEKGLGVGRDIAKAKTWYQLAAAQGNASAMHNLAVLFAMGADGTPDNESAARWFLEAAELGVTDSQFNLGILAAKGVGMPQDLEESYKWFALVAKTGDKDAATKRDEVANALTPEQLERARATAELWKAKAMDPAANFVDVPASWKDGEETTAGLDVEQAVRNIQLILARNGYDAGAPDGIMGAKTKAAIAAFQKENGMTPTGEVDEELVQTLHAQR